MEELNNYIYGLVDPFTYQIRYIGKSKNPINRYKKHLYPYYLKAETYKNRWIRGCLKRGEKPILLIICGINDKIYNINELEKFFIGIFKQIDGNRLTNGTAGGDGGATMTGKKMPKTAIQKTIEKQKGRKWDKDDPRREQLRQKQKGKEPIYATQKAAEKNTLYWEITYPTGEKEIVKGLKDFAEKHNLSMSKLSAVARGEKYRTHHKGFKVRKCEKVQD